MPAPIPAYPFSACLEGGQIGSILPGIYDFPHYRCRTYSVATNKPPILPYRGVARTGVCFALEVTLDALARELGMEPTELRLQEPGSPRADALRQYRASAISIRATIRRRSGAARGDRPRGRARTAAKRGEPDGRLIGLGFSMYAEQAGHGTSVYASWGMPLVPGFEQCHRAADARWRPRTPDRRAQPWARP